MWRRERPPVYSYPRRERERESGRGGFYGNWFSKERERAVAAQVDSPPNGGVGRHPPARLLEFNNIGPALSCAICTCGAWAAPARNLANYHRERPQRQAPENWSLRAEERPVVKTLSRCRQPPGLRQSGKLEKGNWFLLQLREATLASGNA